MFFLIVSFLGAADVGPGGPLRLLGDRDPTASEPPRIGGQRRFNLLLWAATYYLQFLIEFAGPKKAVPVQAGLNGARTPSALARSPGVPMSMNGASEVTPWMVPGARA